VPARPVWPPITWPRTASSTTPCNSSLRPHLHVAVASPPRRTRRQRRRHLSTTVAAARPPACAPCSTPSPRTITCKPTHARCCRVVASSPTPLLCAHAVWAPHVALPRRPPHANHASRDSAPSSPQHHRRGRTVVDSPAPRHATQPPPLLTLYAAPCGNH
jgi:hypothetical protein